MRLDELFKNLGYIAGNIGAQIRDSAAPGVPLEDLDLTGPAPTELSQSGPAQVVVSRGEVFRVDIEPGPGNADVRFGLTDTRLTVAGGERDTVVRITVPALTKIAVAGSGHMRADALAADGEVSIAGSGRLEIGAVGGGTFKANIAGSGRLAADGRVHEFELSIAGSGSCDAEGLVTEQAAVHIAGSGDAIFTCHGEVRAHLMGSGNVIVRGGARCSVHSMGSGTVTCEAMTEVVD
jgi:hypothetical protein